MQSGVRLLNNIEQLVHALEEAAGQELAEKARSRKQSSPLTDKTR